MKIRKDYVTNSSSSSFVIAYKDIGNFDDDTLKKYPFLKGFQNAFREVLMIEGDETTSAEFFRTKEEFDRHIVDVYGWSKANTIEKILEDDYDPELYKKAIAYLNSGYVISEKNVGYSDTGIARLIAKMSDGNDCFVILDSEW